VQRVIKDSVWCPTIDVTLAHREGHEMPINPDCENWSHLNRDKDQPREVYFVYQHYGGPTLASWVERHEQEAAFVPQLQQLVQQVRDICNELKTLAVVHGDLHGNNLCVTPVKTTAPMAVGASRKDVVLYGLKVIDFGWCLHRSFDMDVAEREYYEQCLQSDWDWKHFCDALEYSYHDRPWFTQLKLD